MKQVTIDEVPRQIADAVQQVEEYFANRGVLLWALGGVQSRVKSSPAPQITRTVDATASQLVQAVMAKDRPPTMPEDAIYTAAQHLGLCCLGGRAVRLELPNGRILEITLK